MRHTDHNAPSDDGNGRKNVNDVDDKVVVAIHRSRMNEKHLAAIKHGQRRDNRRKTSPKHCASRRALATGTGIH